MTIKRAVLRTLTVPGVAALFAPLLRDRATILVLHRCRDDEHGVAGLDPAALDRGLAWLRRHRYELVPLDDLFERLAGRGPPLRRTVAFTIDDGYYDHATIAAPVFARYDCPVTTFVTTGFLDGALWFWWDRIEYVFAHTRRRSASVRLDGVELRFAWDDAAGALRAHAEFIAWCVRVPDETKHAGIAALAESAEVALPDSPPPRYRPMSWDQARACERGGMRFGPHTVTHPILARVGDEQSRRELTESWRRLCAEVRHPVPVFAYPNGGLDDFGPREVALLEELGLLGAVVGVGGYADPGAFRGGPSARFMVPRFGFLPDLPHLIQVVAGVERLKRIVRREEAA